jgi:hypothetical protein
LITRGIDWVGKKAIPWVKGKLGAIKQRIQRFFRDTWNRIKERGYRALEKLGLKEVKIGHSKPWNQMTKSEKKAFQHSYDRHAHELGLPPWSESKAEVLRQQFNAATLNIRQNAQRVSVTYKPFGVKGSGAGSKSVPVRFFEYTDPGGIKYYYYETLEGKFISSGLAKP